MRSMRPCNRPHEKSYSDAFENRVILLVKYLLTEAFCKAQHLKPRDKNNKLE